MLRWIPRLALILTACDEEPIAVPPVGAPIPGVEARSVGPVPGAEVPTSREPGLQSCITRYDFQAGLPDAECTTARVDGDPLHWITTCPEHEVLVEEEEILVDEAGRVLFDATRDSDRSWTRALTYDELGRLVQIQFDTENEPTGDHLKTFTEFNEQGQPLHMVETGDDWVIAGHRLPAGNQYGFYEYDALGRLIDHEVRFTVNDSLYVHVRIDYDDAARRRNWEVIVDTSGIDPSIPGPGENGGYDLFDEENRLIENFWFNPGFREGRPNTFLTRYRYDEDDLLLDTAHEANLVGRDDYQYTAHEVYDCP